MKKVSFNILLFVSENCQYSQKEYEGKGHGTDPLSLPVLAATDCGVDQKRKRGLQLSLALPERTTELH